MLRMVYKLGLILCFCFGYFAMQFAFAEANTNQLNFLNIADIHFDPFNSCYKQTACPLIQKLIQANVSEWPNLFNKYDQAAPAYHEDTNYGLLLSALTEAKEAAKKQKIDFVLILGDFLGHDFRAHYKKYAQDKARASYQAFVRKTFLFLAEELKTTFADVDVYAVVGNNDSYQGDYVSRPGSAFFQDTALIFSSLVKDKQNKFALQREFPVAGYYVVDLPKASNLQLIMLNSNLFSTKAKGKGVHEAAQQELNWLQHQLQAEREQHHQALIVMHIPMSIDLHLFNLVDLWDSTYKDQFQADLKEYTAQITGIFTGHLHTEWSQTYAFDNSKKIPVYGMPSISPIFGNDPAFKIYQYTEEKEELRGIATYFLPLNSEPLRWRVE